MEKEKTRNVYTGNRFLANVDSSDVASVHFRISFMFEFQSIKNMMRILNGFQYELAEKCQPNEKINVLSKLFQYHASKKVFFHLQMK